MNPNANQQDRWSDWLLRRRSGGEKDGHARVLERLKPVRDRVLENARLADNDTLLDVGTGDGLIGLGALDRLGPTGHVIFSDISVPCLQYVSGKVDELGALDRASFVSASADLLNCIDDGSVDVVTTRSVLIYVKNKRAVLEEFFRALRPGGRISLAEPINRDYLSLNGRRGEFYGYDATAIAPLIERLRAADIKDFDEDPMTDFTHGSY